MLLRRAATKDFVVYSKPPIAGPEQILRYLDRHTRHVALSNERLLAHHYGQVTFSYKDHKHAGHKKFLTLPGAKFTRRFARVQRLLANGVEVRTDWPAPASCCSPTTRPPNPQRSNRVLGRTPIAASLARIPCSAQTAASDTWLS